MTEEKRTANRKRSRSAVHNGVAFGGAYQMQSQCGVSAAQSNKDLHLERYLTWLEGRAPADCLPLTLALEQYARFQETADAKHRHQAWRHVHAATAEVGRRRAPREGVAS
jgi:hypothetical protein